MKRIEAVNIFGDPITLEVSEARRPEIPKGYAATPGSGPSDETCRTCAHSTSTGHGLRNYWKCALMREHWTYGYGTDIRLKSPACRLWTATTEPA